MNMVEVPLILIFSYFVALLLRKKFKGAAIVKTIFFLTVILSSDLFLRMQDSVGAVNNAQMNAAMSESQELFTAMQAIDLSQYFTALGISPSIMNYICLLYTSHRKRIFMFVIPIMSESLFSIRILK